MSRFLFHVKFRHVLALVAGYSLIYLVWFWQTTFGMMPVLDGQENLVIARQIAAGELPVEPFYRAMLYPAVLALMLKGGIEPGSLARGAGLLGLVCHLLGTFFVHRSTRALWGKTAEGDRTALLAASLFGFNPVAVYFAGEVMDVTFALALALGGMYAALLAREAVSGRAAIWWGTAAAVGWGLASIARPNYLPLVVAGPVLLSLTVHAGRRRVGLACAAAGLAVILAGGCVQWAHCGQFRLSPWQGAYNLWAANKPGANGKYFAQEVTYAAQGEHQNPARLESEVLYLRATGRTPTDIEAMNRYWQGKFWTHVREEPGAWVGLMGRKAYYLFNTFEQYNNKTYAFQRMLSPWLRWNPLHWGLTFVLGVMGATVLWRRTEQRGAVTLVAGLAVAYATGTLLYFASDRFRLPLLPVVCIFAGGAPLVLEARSWTRVRQVGTAVAVGFAGLLTYTPFFDAHDMSTVVMDKVLMADAAMQLGNDPLAADVSRKLVSDRRVRLQAIPIFLSSYANLRLDRDATFVVAAYGDWAAQEPLWAVLAEPDPDLNLQFVRILHLWNTGHHVEAVSRWRVMAGKATHPRAANALACLLVSGAWRPEDELLLTSFLSTSTNRVNILLNTVLAWRYAPGRLTPEQKELVKMYQRLLSLPEDAP